MSAEITMPQLSDTMTEGTVVKWLKREGDKVRAGDKIAEIETDKAVMEMETFESGVLAAVLVGAGRKVSVGSVLAVVATGNENPQEVKKEFAAKPRATTAALRKPAVPPRDGFETANAGEIREPDDVVGHGATRETAVSVPPISRKLETGEDRIRVSPLARRIAAGKNIDLHSLRGSGPGGRIVKQDVLAFQTRSASAASAAAPRRLGSGEKQTIALTQMRSAIARSLQASKRNIPHFYESIDADVEDLSNLRSRLNELLEPEKIRLSLGDFLAKAIAMALHDHPALNSTFDGTEITRHGDVHLGMAVSIPDGLIVPVLRNIQLMGLKEIRQRSVDLVDRARAQRLRQEEMTGATFTVSNLGTYGIREFSAIINPPQVAILAIAAAEKRAVVHGEQVVPRTMMTMTLSADHRVVDGAVAAEFMRTLKSLLEQPGLMLV